jgi:hypothetical protein
MCLVYLGTLYEKYCVWWRLPSGPLNLLLSTDALIPTFGLICFLRYPVMFSTKIPAVVSNKLERERESYRFN